MTCSRVIIIHKGRIEACDTPENLLGQIRQAGGVVVEAKVGSDNGAEELKKISGVRDVTTDSDGDWKIFSLRVESGRRCARGNFSTWPRRAAGPCANYRSAAPRSKTCSSRSRIRMKHEEHFDVRICRSNQLIQRSEDLARPASRSGDVNQHPMRGPSPSSRFGMTRPI